MAERDTSIISFKFKCLNALSFGKSGIMTREAGDTAQASDWLSVVT